jgi:ATP-dependent DNA ligase
VTGRPAGRGDAGLPVPLDLEPMESQTVDALPTGQGWLYEPKYDGFRCLAFRDGADVHLQSRNQKPLNRYFPELVAGVTSLPQPRFVLDSEIIIPDGSFETLQLRLHPAASRVAMLAKKHPARLVAFDLLVDAEGNSLLLHPFSSRRQALERFFAAAAGGPTLQLSKATRSASTARRWLGVGGLDGIMAKRLNLPYRPGERAMAKFKLWKTIDCVVGGYYRKQGTQRAETLLLGLYDEEGRLNYVGRTRVPGDPVAMTERLAPLVGGPGFTGRAPGGKSRWTSREREPIPLDPVLVVEVSADHITGEHMRHGSRILRWREDKPPEACTMEQIRA